MRCDLTSPEHPDRGTLLAWSEGELAWWRAVPVARHVRSCWACRAKVKDLEAAVCAVTVKISELPEPSPVEVKKAYWRLRESVREHDSNLAVESRATRRTGWRGAGMAVLLATAALAYVANSPIFHSEAPLRQTAAKKRDRRAFTPPERNVRGTPGVHLTAPSAPAVEMSAVAAPVPPGLVVSDEELAAAEVHALAALHRARLCLNSGITVRRVGSFVEATGMTRSREQRISVEALLAGIARPEVLMVLLVSPEDVVSPPTVANNAVSSGVETGSDESKPPIVGWLKENLRGRPALTERDLFNLMNSLALDSERASSEAWALRHLAEQFPETRMRDLRPDLTSVVLQMLEDHAGVLASDLKSLHERLVPGTRVELSGGSRAREGASWQSNAMVLQADVEEAVRRLLASFSTSGAVPAEGIRGIEERTRACLSMAGSLRSELRAGTEAAFQGRGH
jgi:hypothetical protein